MQQKPQRKYDELVVWLEGRNKDYVRKTKWVRGIVADGICAAGESALAEFKDRICPSISMIWPQTST